jgi:hypothetical protein
MLAWEAHTAFGAPDAPFKGTFSIGTGVDWMLHEGAPGSTFTIPGTALPGTRPTTRILNMSPSSFEAAPEDPYVFIQWARYRQAQIFGKEMAEDLEEARHELVKGTNQNTDAFTAHLINAGLDLRHLVLKSNGDRALTRVEVEHLSELLAKPLIERWESFVKIIE